MAGERAPAVDARLALSGQRGMALAQYESCQRILETELGIEPEVETTALYEQIRVVNSNKNPPETETKANIRVNHHTCNPPQPTHFSDAICWT